MKKLSEREEEIMSILWNDGNPLFIREIIDRMTSDGQSRPNFSTIATFVRGLETKGWLAHEMIGNCNRYYPVKSLAEYRANSLKSMVSRFFGGSYLNLVSTLISNEKISSDDMEKILGEIERQRKEDES